MSDTNAPAIHAKYPEHLRARVDEYLSGLWFMTGDPEADAEAAGTEGLVEAMREDPLFKQCKWQTSVPDGGGSNTELTGCMTLCDSGYHEWEETMNGYKHPTSTAEGLWSARYMN